MQPRATTIRSVLLLVVLLAGLIAAPPPRAAAAGAITGTVFHDFNADGAFSTSGAAPNFAIDKGIGGVTVTAYNQAGTAVATAASSSTPATLGQYTLDLSALPANTPLRIEFTGLPVGYQPAPVGANTNTSVRFLTATVAAQGSVNFGLIDPEEYCQNNPSLAVSCFVTGDNTGSTSDALVSYAYNANGLAAAVAKTKLAGGGQVGTIYGLAYQRSTQSLFGSTYVRRGAGVGPSDSTGTIYRMSPMAAFAPSAFVELNGLAGINTGPNPHPNGVVGYDWVIDSGAYGAVGKVGLGDLDISEDEQTLYTVNLYQRELIVIPLDPGPVARTAGIVRVPIPTPATGVSGVVQGCPSSDLRPFGLKYYGGSLYVGIVCSGESQSAPTNAAQLLAVRAAMRAYIYRLDPASNTFAATPELEFGLDYPRLQVNDGLTNPLGVQEDSNGEWLPWTDTWRPAYAPRQGSGLFINPQPMLTDIEFDGQGFMMVGFRDRFADQAYSAGDPGPAGGTLYNTRQGGDLLLACQDPSNQWVLESNGTCGARTTATLRANSGPGGGEFYHSERYNPYHEETGLGSLAQLPGSSELVTTLFDAFNTFEAGTAVFNTVNGNRVRAVQTYAPNTGFTKGGGLGDIELLCSAAPVEVGNRVWNDLDRDGVQDAGEPGIPGVTVRLYAFDGTPLGTTVTDATGSYRFSSASGTNTLGAVYNVAGLTPNTAGFQIRLDGGADYAAGGPLAGYGLTVADVQTGDSDASGDITDSDGTLPSPAAPIGTGNFPAKTFSTGAPGANNHTYDFGFVDQTLSLGNVVWNDVNNNGVQDGGEAGITGVRVLLYAADGTTEMPVGADGILGTADDGPGGVLTGANGLYLFRRLPPGDYVVALPATNFQAGGPLVGYTSSTGTNGSLTGPVEPAPDPDTTAADGDDNGSASGPLGSGGDIRSQVITLSQGGEPTGESPSNDNVTEDASANLTIDFGVFQPAYLGDRVWYDVNHNGVQDGVEIGVPGVTATLYDAATNTVVATDVTDASGLYLFPNLVPGSYYVIFSDLPTGYVFTTPDATGDAADSDANAVTGQTGTYTLAPGDNVQTVDAGIYNDIRASIGNFVWYDLNENGVQDSGEVGVPGVTVELYRPGDVTPYATTTTAADGSYLFSNLLEGDYTVKIVPPVGYSITTANSSAPGATDANDSDANPADGLMTQTTLSPGEADLTWDAGLYYSTVALGNVVWEDANNSGTQDAGETGIAAVQVKLFDKSGLTEIPVGPDGILGTADDGPGGVLTDANGFYLFRGLLPGDYIVEVTPPSGYVSSSGVNGAASGPYEGASTPDPDGDSDGDDNGTTVGGVIRSAPITLARNGEPTGEGTALPNPDTATPDLNSNLTLDFGLYQPLSLGNLVWNDINNNGLVDSGEAGVAGVVVELYLDGNSNGQPDPGELVMATTTDGFGNYGFTNLVAGTYLVVLPASNFATGGPLVGYSSSTGQYGPATGPFEPAPTPDNDRDNDDNGTAQGGVIVTLPVLLSPGGEPTGDGDGANGNLTVDFGVFQPASLGNVVWFDTDKDGVKDPGEAGVPGVTVTLYDALGNVVATTTTDASGAYSFGNLAPGTYTVGFGNLPANTTFTTPNTGDDGLDSDVNPATGMSGPVTLVPGENNPSIFAGIIDNQQPTAVSLVRFTARWAGDALVVAWETSAEQSTLGFHLLRSASGRRADAERVTPQLILARASGGGGASYTWADPTAKAGVAYSYWLEETELGGSTSEYGPARLEASPAATYRVWLPMVRR